LLISVVRRRCVVESRLGAKCAGATMLGQLAFPLGQGGFSAVEAVLCLCQPGFRVRDIVSQSGDPLF
jgi:hypothetical protein